MGLFSKKEKSRDNENKGELQNFTATREVVDFLKVDETAKLWYTAVGKERKLRKVHKFSEIVDFELIDDGTTKISGGIGKAIAGGVIFGTVGAVIGGTTARKKQTEICTDLKIKVTIRDISEPTLYIPFVSGRMKRDSMLFQAMMKYAQECISLLQVMCDAGSGPENGSLVEEIKKFKELLDSGVITAEEFETKKKQLLGL